MRAVESCIYADGDDLVVEVYHAAWAQQKQIARLPVTHLETARRMRDEIRGASLATVNDVVGRWRSVAVDAMGERVSRRRKAGKKTQIVVQPEEPALVTSGEGLTEKLTKWENNLIEAVRAAVEADKRCGAAREAVEQAQTELKQAELAATAAWVHVDNALLGLRGQ